MGRNFICIDDISKAQRPTASKKFKLLLFLWLFAFSVLVNFQLLILIMHVKWLLHLISADRWIE